MTTQTMTTKSYCPVPLEPIIGGSKGAIRKSRLGFFPSTPIATVNGYKPASELTADDEVLTASGEQVRVVSTLHRVIDPMIEVAAEDRPIYIPANTIGNQSALTVLPDQNLMASNAIGVLTKVSARDLLGSNGVRRLDPEEMTTAIEIRFAKTTAICCANGAVAVCQGKTQYTDLARALSLVA